MISTKIGSVDRALELVLSLDQLKPSPNLPRELDNLFITLSKSQLEEPLDVVEGSIWALWCGHSDEEAVLKMEQVIGGLSQGRLEVAERLLNLLIRDFPDWPEARNKRATLYYLQNRDEESITDIEATLRLEPRHFGALGGFGQICLRQDEPHSACIAFEKALKVNPHLDGVREIVAELGSEFRRVIN